MEDERSALVGLLDVCPDKSFGCVETRASTSREDRANATQAFILEWSVMRNRSGSAIEESVYNCLIQKGQS